MNVKTLLYIACMAGVTYLIRVLPLTLIRKEIKNNTLRSFLYYVPYVTLAVMTFPAIISSTPSPCIFRQKSVSGGNLFLRHRVSR